MIKKLFSIAVMFVVLPSWAQDNFSIFLVRHAEKAINHDNPSLTNCGFIRANQLATMLDKVGIEKVYSTSYARTLETAAPLSKNKNIAIKQYSPRGLEQLALTLKREAKTSLIVGHSNTTPMLVNLLADADLPALSEAEYTLIYQVQFINDQTNLTIIKHPLVCN